MERAVLQLPRLAQHQIFTAACARFPLCARFPPCDLLARLPPGLHPGALEAAISSPGRALKIKLPTYPNPLFGAVAALSASPPSILSLEADCSTWRCDTISTDLLATALSHHSGLTRLSLLITTAQYASSATSLLAPVASLTSLQSLHLGVSIMDSVPEASMPALHQAVQSLPQLTRFCVSLVFDVKRVKRVQRKRRRSAADCTPPPHCLAAMLSAASGLTSLALGLHTVRRRGAVQPQVRGGWAFNGSSAPVILPHLGHLNARVQDCGCAAALLHRLDAPLTSLRLGEQGLRADDGNAHDDFVQSLASFTRLRSMHVTGVIHPWVFSALSAALTPAPAASPAVQGVRELKLNGCLVWVAGAVGQLSAATPRLQSLSLHILTQPIGRGNGSLNTTAAEQAAWVQLVEHLRRLRLQHLALSASVHTGHCGPALSSLCLLTCMSALMLDQIDRPLDITGLSRLTQLQFLHIHRVGLPEETRSRLVPSLRALRSLTNLALSGAGVPEAFAASFTAQKAQGAWPALRALGVHVAMSRPEVELHAVVRAACSLPALQRLMLVHDTGDGQYETSEADKLKLEGLLEIASGAGVTATAATPVHFWRGFSDLEDAFLWCRSFVEP